MSPACVWDDLIGQRRAIEFLRGSVETGRVGHAYLFVGPAGAGKKTAARAFACAVLCDDNGCGSCRACYRVKHGYHPDVHIIQPQGAASYMVGQIRPIIHDVTLAPVDGPRKVYIFESADLMNDSAANAFLKTLEEPPDDVLIIMLAPTYDAVLPTISSRCLVVRFERIAPDVAARLLAERTGASPIESAAALAATGGVLPRAAEFLESASRRAARDRMLSILKDLSVLDEYDVLSSARELLALVKAPLGELKEVQAAEIKQREEFAGKVGGKSVEERHKRELTAREREGIAEILNISESWLRDCLVLS
ncbi:DNA polymerase III subunit delta', partial [bacterium]|nr:DNA polymerase III subunit delta' [bacterium]